MSEEFEHSLPDDLQELERSLASFKPEALDSVSKGRLSAAIIHAEAEPSEQPEEAPTKITDTPSIRTRVAWGAWGSLAAAIALAVGLNVGSRNQVTTPETTFAHSPEPTSTESISPARIPSDATALATQSQLKEVIDDGIILTESSSRMRQVRTLYTDTVSWTDPDTEARLEMSYQREELFLIPIDAI